jgi:hypothetical protein
MVSALVTRNLFRGVRKNVLGLQHMLSRLSVLHDAQISINLHETNHVLIPANAAVVSRVLTMVYNTQNCWVFGLCPSSGILKTREHNVSEIGSASVLR